MKERFRKAAEGVRAGTERAKQAFATAVVKKRVWFTVAFGVLFALAAVGFFFVNTNYDSTTYLPADSEVKRGLDAMYADFGSGGNAACMAEKAGGLSYEDSLAFKKRTESVEGIAGVLWLDDLFGAVTAGFDESCTQSEYAQGFLLVLNVASGVDVSTLAEGTELSLPLTREQTDAIVDTTYFLLGKTIKDELSSCAYTVSFDRSRVILKSLVYQLTTSDVFSGLDAQTLDFENLNALLSGFSTSVAAFYGRDETGAYYPLYQLSFSGTDYEKTTMNAMDELRKAGKDKGLTLHFSGNAATTYNSIHCVETQTTYALFAVGGVVLVLLFVFSTSFWEPILYLVAIAVAVVINMGSNVLLGSVSYLTSGVAGVLQLALSMDYSIFIMTRFKQEKERTTDVEEAMIAAVKASLGPVGASSLTTVASFVAIMFMRYSIGLDMGIVFAKGVLLSLFSVFMFLPGLAIYTNKWTEKSAHKTFPLTMKKYTRGVLKCRKVLPVAFLALIVVAAVGQNYMTFGYGDTATFGSKGSIIYADKQAIEAVFGSQNQLAIVLTGESATRAVGDRTTEEVVTEALAGKEYVLTAQSYALIQAGGMDAMLPEKFLSQFVGEKYRRIVCYLDLEEEGDKTERAIAEIRGILRENGVGNDEYYLLGGSSSAIEIKTIVNSDYKLISWMTVLLVFVILLVTFRSAILPVLLVFVIQGSVWISMSVNVLTGDSLVFLGYLIVSAVMLGATIDYGILLTENYLEQRKLAEKTDAMVAAVGRSSRAILNSSLILACAGFIIALTSTMPAITAFGQLIGRTALVSLALVLVLLPCLLVVFDKWIQKTTLGARFFTPVVEPAAGETKEARAQAAASEDEEGKE